MLLSSHRLDEIQAVCDRLVVIVGGSVRFDGSAEQLAGATSFAAALHDLLVSDERHGSIGSSTRSQLMAVVLLPSPSATCVPRVVNRSAT